MRRRSIHVLAMTLIVASGVDAVADEFAAEREQMVRSQIEARGVHDPAVLAALRRVPRHRFVRCGSSKLVCRHLVVPGPWAGRTGYCRLASRIRLLLEQDVAQDLPAWKDS